MAAAVPLILASVPSPRADVPRPVSAAVTAAVPPPVLQHVEADAHLTPAATPPQSIYIPQAKVSAPVTSISAASGTLPVPSDLHSVGWMQESALPGDVGPSVFVGHVDGKAGPAVFYHLRDLVLGTDIDIRRLDGSTVTYRVDEVSHYGKSDLPLDRIYGPVISPELRLITCGGAFDRASGHYEDNVVVYATAVQ